MWIFGYGSLIWGDWERDLGCRHRVTAELRGYARAFNKLSTYNWGTKANPGPTLNLVASASSCQGIAFEFDDASRADVIAYLLKREGDGFALKEMPIIFEGGEAATALVPLYQGRNIIPPTDAAEIAAMALKAKGVSGSCISYIEDVTAHLRKLGINDSVVAELCGALAKLRK